MLWKRWATFAIAGLLTAACTDHATAPAESAPEVRTVPIAPLGSSLVQPDTSSTTSLSVVGGDCDGGEQMTALGGAQTLEGEDPCCESNPEEGQYCDDDPDTEGPGIDVTETHIEVEQSSLSAVCDRKFQQGAPECDPRPPTEGEDEDIETALQYLDQACPTIAGLARSKQFVMWDADVNLFGSHDHVGDGQILLWSGEGDNVDWRRTIAHETAHFIYGDHERSFESPNLERERQLNDVVRSCGLDPHDPSAD